MKRTIILTEQDIRNIVKDSLQEYYIHESQNEGKVKNALLASMLGLSGVAALHQHANPSNTNPIPQSIFIEDHNDVGDTNTLNYSDYMQQQYSNRYAPKNIPQNKQKTISSKSSNIVNSKKQKEYSPSKKLIQFIKDYETFHVGWQDDGVGNLTTGWGFKITPELKKRYPNGMHTTKEADAYLNEYIQKNLPRFKELTPNIDLMPTEVGDGLFDLFFNIGEGAYKQYTNLHTACEQMDMDGIIANVRAGFQKGHWNRSNDRQRIVHGDYNNSKYIRQYDEPFVL